MEKTIINGVEMDALAMEYKAIQTQIDALEAQLEAVKDNIKARLTSACLDDFRTETFHFIWKVIPSSRFDSTAFKRDNPVIAAQYTRQSETRPLKIC